LADYVFHNTDTSCILLLYIIFSRNIAFIPHPVACLGAWRASEVLRVGAKGATTAHANVSRLELSYKCLSGQETEAEARYQRRRLDTFS